MASDADRPDAAHYSPPTEAPAIDSRARGGSGTMASPTGRLSGIGGLRNLRTFESFKVPAFRYFYGGMLSQMAAMNMELIARGLLIYQMTGSGTILGIMAMANSLPMLVFSLFGGVLSDRVHKKTLMIFGQAANAVLALGVAVAITTGVLSADNPSGTWILIVASLFKGSVQGLMLPARQAIIPELVRRDLIMNALALNNMGMNIFRILSPALAGFAIAWWGYGSIYYLMTGLFVAATLFSIPLPKTPSATFNKVRKGAMTDLVGGFKYIWQDRTIGLLLIFVLFAVLLSQPYMMLLPIITEDILHVGSRGMGILLSVSGLGAIGGSLLLASLPDRWRGAMLLGTSFILGAALLAFSFSAVWSLSLAAIVFVGIGQAGRITLAGALLQSYVEDDYRGRVMSVYMMEFGLTGLSVMVAGMLSDSIGIQWSIGSMAIMLMVLCIAVGLLVPKLRKLH